MTERAAAKTRGLKATGELLAGRQVSAEWLRSYHRQVSQYTPFFLTADIVLLTIRDGQLSVLLVRRGDEPHRDWWCLPGGFVQPDESSEQAAYRELHEETGIDALPRELHLEKLSLYDEPKRDDREYDEQGRIVCRVISSAYLAMMPDMPTPTAGDDAVDARWWPIADLEQEDGPELGFDHTKILAAAVERARSKIEYTTVAASFVREPFTMGDLRRVYEAVWGTGALDHSNFRTKVLENPGFVEPVGQVARREKGTTGGRPSPLYRRGPAFFLERPIMRPEPVEGTAEERVRARSEAHKPGSPASSNGRARGKK